jgi:hypothetical protein
MDLDDSIIYGGQATTRRRSSSLKAPLYSSEVEEEHSMPAAARTPVAAAPLCHAYTSSLPGYVSDSC